MGRRGLKKERERHTGRRGRKKEERREYTGRKIERRHGHVMEVVRRRRKT